MIEPNVAGGLIGGGLIGLASVMMLLLVLFVLPVTATG